MTKDSRKPSLRFEIPQWAVPLVFAGVVLAVYAPVVIITFGTLDDYFFQYRKQYEGVNENLIHYLSRPILFLFNNVAFSFVNIVSEQSLVRLAGVLLAALLAWQCYRLLDCLRPFRAYRLWIALAIVFLPAFQVCLPIAVDFSYPFAASLGILAATICTIAFENIRSRGWWALLVLAAIALIAAIMIYQPNAMFYWLGISVFLFGRCRSTRSLLLNYAAYCAMFFISAAAIYIALRIVGNLDDSRATLIQDIGGKVAWFITQPFVNSLNLYNIPANPLLAIGVGLFVSVGLWFYFVGGRHYRLTAYLVCLSLLPAAYAPNLIVAENWPGYRTTGAMTALILLYFFMAVRGYARISWFLTNKIGNR